MTHPQLAILFILFMLTLILILIFIRTRRKATAPKPTKHQETKTIKPRPQKTLLEISKQMYPSKEKKLPRRFTNRPGVKQSQVNLKKSGYREDAKIEEDPNRDGKKDAV